MTRRRSMLCAVFVLLGCLFLRATSSDRLPRPTGYESESTNALPAGVLAALPPLQREMLSNLAARPSDETGPRLSVCFAEGTDPDVVTAFNDAANGPAGISAFQFGDGNRWSNTATDGSGLTRGDPTTLTWGIVPDGTPINGFAGEAANTSDLVARMDFIYGAGPGGSDLTLRPWFPLYQDVFDEWSELIGVNYVYEPADDGASQASAAGSIGVRADVRIGGHLIDGNGGILAYNFFPNTSDMVIDTADSVYLNTSNNSRILRNILAHEHGHGLGISHICPVTASWLMEPFLATGFDGPQADDILAGNRGYGDRDEFPFENDTFAGATDLGMLAPGPDLMRTTLSIDGSSDEDFYAFTVPPGVAVTVTVTPTGSTYQNGPQNGNGSCTAGTPFNSAAQSDLALELIGTDGTSVLASSTGGAAGAPESVAGVPLAAAGTYAARITGGSDAAQLYDIEIGIADTTAPAVTCSLTRTTLVLAHRDLRPVGLSVAATDNVDPNPTLIVAVYSDEPEGSWPFVPDATGAGPALRLRAERRFGGAGRIYLIVARAVDASGNVGFACRTVLVPLRPTLWSIVALRARAAVVASTCTATGSPMTPSTILGP